MILVAFGTNNSGSNPGGAAIFHYVIGESSELGECAGGKDAARAFHTHSLGEYFPTTFAWARTCPCMAKYRSFRKNPLSSPSSVSRA